MNKPGKWLDLSSPDGASVNDSIEKDTCSLSYISVDMVADKALALGVGALLAKLDIKQAHRMAPVQSAGHEVAEYSLTRPSHSD